jgi:hypothetical protein
VTDEWADQVRSTFATRLEEMPVQLRKLAPAVMVEPLSDERDPDALARLALCIWARGADWIVWGILAATPQGPILRRLTIEPCPPHDRREVTLAVVRELSPAQVREQALSVLRVEQGETWQAVAAWAGWRPSDEERAAHERATRAASESRPRQGRPPLPDEHYRRISAEYLRLQEQRGNARGLLGELAKRESRRQGREVPRETVRDWIHGARKRGFLMPGKPGRAGAEPGPRLTKPEEER